jgi:hypothetical protein
MVQIFKITRRTSTHSHTWSWPPLPYVCAWLYPKRHPNPPPTRACPNTLSPLCHSVASPLLIQLMPHPLPQPFAILLSNMIRILLFAFENLKKWLVLPFCCEYWRAWPVHGAITVARSSSSTNRDIWIINTDLTFDFAFSY